MFADSFIQLVIPGRNLHYKVLPKPASAPAVIEAMVNYITEHHSGDTGIIYCLSKKVCIHHYSQWSLGLAD